MAVALDVDRLVDDQKFSRFNLGLLIWSFLALFADGFEISSIGLAAPHIIREWGVPAGSLGPMMSASLAGIFVGAPLLGWVGDRYGRRFAIIAGCMLFGITTLAVVATTNVTQITVLRFFTGIGMGGIFPNTIALSSELSPKRLRAKLVILMFMGITLGSSAPGIVAIGAVPTYGWKVIFLMGGVIPLVVSFCLIFTLPESVKFLARLPHRHAELLRTARRMRPDLTLADDTRFIVPPARPAGRIGVGPILSGALLPITLLLWVCFATTLMANYFLNSWMPVLFEAKGISTEGAAFATTIYHFGGLFGGLLMSVLFDRFGFLPVAILLALACPAMLAIGIPGISEGMLALLVTLAGFSVVGAQFGSNAGAGLLYPTAFRSKAVGIAFSISRFGSILGPIIGATLIGWQLPLPVLLLAITGPMILGAIASIALAWLTYRRFGGWRLSEMGDEEAAGSGETLQQAAG